MNSQGRPRQSKHFLTFERPSGRSALTVNAHSIESFEHRRTWQGTQESEEKRVVELIMKSGEAHVVYANPDRLARMLDSLEYNPGRGAGISLADLQRDATEAASTNLKKEA